MAPYFKSLALYLLLSNTMKLFFAFLLSSLIVSGVSANSLVPAQQSMMQLFPQSSARQRIIDRLFFSQGTQGGEMALYGDSSRLQDLNERLERVRRSGDSRQILTESEWVQFNRNRAELSSYERNFFSHWSLYVPVSLTIPFQRLMTRLLSVRPRIDDSQFESTYLRYLSENVLYQSWHYPVTQDFPYLNSHLTWGEFLLEFSSNSNFRNTWIYDHPETLEKILELTKKWAWEDRRIQKVKVENIGTPSEYWVLERRSRQGGEDIPNVFDAVIAGDYQRALEYEFAPTVFFNRLSKVEQVGDQIVYSLEPIEKGRSMELYLNEDSLDKRVIFGGEILRLLKMDELVQRQYVSDGTLSLFLGPRTIQLDQVHRLVQSHPELVLSLGQFGFSVTGGQAQSTTLRTDHADQQLLKLVASLMDVVEFAKTGDVQNWFRRNVQNLVRSLLIGSGAGGTIPLDSLRNQGDSPLVAPQCRQLF